MAAILFSKAPACEFCFLWDRRVIKRKWGGEVGVKMAAGLFIYILDNLLWWMLYLNLLLYLYPPAAVLYSYFFARKILNFYIFLKIFITDGLTMCLKTEKYR